MKPLSEIRAHANDPMARGYGWSRETILRLIQALEKCVEQRDDLTRKYLQREFPDVVIKETLKPTIQVLNAELERILKGEGL